MGEWEMVAIQGQTCQMENQSISGPFVQYAKEEEHAKAFLAHLKKDQTITERKTNK